MLVVRTRPKHDESYLGFLLRLTELNFYETPYWIVQEASLRPKGYPGICSFVFDPEVDLAPLAALSGLNADALQDLVYCPVDDKCGVRVFGQRLPRYLLRLRESRVCPECLRQSPYSRKQWDLAVVTSCPIHQILLLENCHKCGRKITWRRKQVTFCPCGADWRSARVVLLAESETVVSRLVYQKFGLMEPPSESVTNNPLYLLDLPSILEALFLIASQQERRIDAKGRSMGYGKQSHQIHANLAKAFSVFESWPNNFYKFLDQVRRVKKSLKAKSGLNNNFGGVYRHLYTSGKLSPSLCEVLRNEFERYVSEYWDDGYLARSKWFKASKFTGRFVTQRKACRELGLKANVLERFVTSGKLKAVVRRNGRKRLFLVEAESVEQLKLEPTVERKRNRKLGSSRWFSMDEVAELLGISRLSVVRLVKGSLLISKHGPSADQRRAVWKFDKKMVHGFLARVLSATKKGSKHNPRIDLQSFTVVSNVVGRRLAGSGYGVHTLVGDILNGLLIPRAEAPGKSGLSRLQFSREEVLQYIKSRADRRESPWIVAGAKKLGIRAEVAQFLASKGLIETGASTGQEKTSRPITREAILLFESTHLFAFDVARALGTTASLLTRALRALDVHPISGKLIDDGPQYVFRKADLDPVDWSRFVSIFPGKKKSEAVLTGGFVRGSATYLTF